MPNFCVKCGSPLSGGPFCVKCGADARNVVPSVQLAIAIKRTAATHHNARRPAFKTGSPEAQKGMSSLAKLGIAAVAIIFVGGAAGVVGVYYVAHKVSQKYHEVSDEILGSGSGSGSDTEDGSANAGSKEFKFD